MLRTALVKAVERRQLERITGKGASGTFQVKQFSTPHFSAPSFFKSCHPFGDWHLYGVKQTLPLSEGDANALKLSQLKRTGNKVLLKGGVLEDAITAAITAMNEPKTCSTTTLRRYLIDTNKDKKEYQLGKRLLLSLLRLFGNGSFVWEQQIGGGLGGAVSMFVSLRYARLATRWRRAAQIGPVCCI